MLLAECFLTALLIVTPAVEGMERYLPDTWLFDMPSLTGLCVSMKGKNEALLEINDQHQLIIVYSFKKYIIPLPPTPGEWKIRYALGDAYAHIDTWGRIQVRRGPKDPI